MRTLWALATITLVACDAGDTDETDTMDADTSDDVDTDETDTDPVDPDPAPIVGAWAEVGGTFPDQSVWGYPEVSETTWTDGYGGSYVIEAWVLDPGYAIAQNAESNPYNPGKYSRFDFASDGEDGFYYCQSAYAAATAAEAEATPRADDADFAAGCGGFTWSHLTPRLPLTGDWTDGYFTHDIDEANWQMADSLFHIADYSVNARFILAWNDEENEWNAGKWSRFDFHQEGDALYYCQSAYDADSQELAAQAESDHGDLSGGCGGWPWSALTAR